MRIIFLTLLLLTGCTTYSPIGDSNTGYSEKVLSPTEYEVSYSAGKKSQSMYDFALLRSAELTIVNGYKYLSITESELDIQKEAKEHKSYKAGISTDSSVTVGYTHSAKWYQDNTRVSIRFKMMNDQGAEKFLDARAVFDEITSKYGMNRTPQR